MLAWFDALHGVELLFATCAIVGALLLTFRLVALFTGFHDSGMGSDIDAAHADADAAFKILTIQGLSAFLTLFGLVGLMLYPRFGTDLAGMTGAIAGGAIAGFLAMQATARLFAAMLHLQSSGSLSLTDCVGTTGTVYLTIQPGTGGKVQVTVANRLREFEALSARGERLDSGVAIRVVDVAGSALVVERKDS
jgi:hypothetical protein